jgi:hypothetical protein
VTLDKATPARGITVLFSAVRHRNGATLLESSRVRHAAYEFSHRLLTRLEPEPDDARRGDEITQALLIWIGNYQSFRIILLA